MNSIDRTENPGKTKDKVFWQTAIHDQRPKLKVFISNIEVEGIVDTGADVIKI